MLRLGGGSGCVFLVVNRKKNETFKRLSFRNIFQFYYIIFIILSGKAIRWIQEWAVVMWMLIHVNVYALY